jgi:hypothetical protein
MGTSVGMLAFGINALLGSINLLANLLKNGIFTRWDLFDAWCVPANVLLSRHVD